MSYPKVCLNCNTPFEAKRDAARYCSEQCKNDWHAENRFALSQEPGQRVEGHALDEVRGLLEEHKGDWTIIVREHARRTLLVTGYLSAADFTALGVPDEHCNLPGAQIGAYANAGYMEAISFKRWSAEAKASRKSGKYWVYRVTQKGKEQLGPLTGIGGSGASSSEGTSLAAAADPSQNQGRTVGHDTREAGDSGDSPDSSGVVSGEIHPSIGQLLDKSDQGRQSPSPTADAGSPDNCTATSRGTGKSASGATDSSDAAGDGAELLTLDESRPETPSMYDAWSDAA